MYLQITEVCNMRCAHCCVSATTAGRHMSFAVAKAALRLAHARGDGITIGGGEPTTHPQFWELFGLVLGTEFDYPPLIVTNGKRKAHALRLAQLAEAGVVQVDLSRDEFHEPIAASVVQAFTRNRRLGNWGATGRIDLRGIRDVSGRVLAVGRAVEEGVADQQGCACEDLFVAPDGALWSCGCRTHALGTVFAPAIPDTWCHDNAHHGGVDEDEQVLAEAA